MGHLGIARVPYKAFVVVLLLFVGFPTVARATPTEQTEVCDSVQDILELPKRFDREDAERYPARADFTAIVTYFDPEWLSLFVQDNEHAVYVIVDWSGQSREEVQALQPGTKLRIKGNVCGGTVKPAVVNASFEIVDQLPPLAPHPVDFSELTVDQFDACWVCGEATIIDVVRLRQRFQLAVQARGKKLNISIPGVTQASNEVLVPGARVKLSGCVGVDQFNSRVLGLRLCVPSIEFVSLVSKPKPVPYQTVTIPSLKEVVEGTVVRIEGDITYSDSERFFLEENSHSVMVSLHHSACLERGERVAVQGRILKRPMGEPAALVRLQGLTVQSLGHRNMQFNNRPYRKHPDSPEVLKNRLSGRQCTIEGDVVGRPNRGEQMLHVRNLNGNYTLRLPPETDMTTMATAKRVSAHGIYLHSPGVAPNLILVDCPTDIQVLERRMHIGWRIVVLALSVALAGSFICFTWITMLRREVSRREETQVESETKYRTIFSQSANAIIVTCQQGLITQANEAANALLGAEKPQRLIGTPLSLFIDIAPTADSDWIPRAILTLESKTTKFIEIQKKSIAAETQWHLRDLTADDAEKKKLQKAAALEAMGLMAGSVAHDMKNMLGVVGMTNEFLEKSVPRDDDFLEAIKRSQIAVAQGSDLASKLMTLGNTTEAEALTPTDIVSIAKEIHRSFTTQPRIQCVADFPDSQLRAIGHPELILRTIVNIYNNALQAIDGEGTVTLGVQRSARKLNGKPAIAISIADTGQGIPPNLLPRVLEPYFTTKHDSGGTGLGLQSAKAAVESMGGEISLDSEVGKGTTVTILLEETKSRSDVLPPSTRALRILVVDDNERVQRSNASLLSVAGFDVIGTTCPDKAGEHLKNERFDVLVTDFMMKPLTGLDLSELAREHQTDCRVVLLTGYQDILEQKASIMGDVIDKVFAKPIRASDLTSYIHDHHNANAFHVT